MIIIGMAAHGTTEQATVGNVKKNLVFDGPYGICDNCQRENELNRMISRAVFYWTILVVIGGILLLWECVTNPGLEFMLTGKNFLILLYFLFSILIPIILYTIVYRIFRFRKPHIRAFLLRPYIILTIAIWIFVFVVGLQNVLFFYNSNIKQTIKAINEYEINGNTKILDETYNKNKLNAEMITEFLITSNDSNVIENYDDVRGVIQSVLKKKTPDSSFRFDQKFILFPEINNVLIDSLDFLFNGLAPREILNFTKQIRAVVYIEKGSYNVGKYTSGGDAMVRVFFVYVINLQRAEIIGYKSFYGGSPPNVIYAPQGQGSYGSDPDMDTIKSWYSRLPIINLKD